MFRLIFGRPVDRRAGVEQKARRAQAITRGKQRCGIEALESRTLFSESASAQLNLVSTTGTQANPVFHYDITVTDTGTTNIGTFWFSWVPEENFLPSRPTSVTSPAGWAASITGSADAMDGSAIEWVASSNPIMPGHSLSGYDFTTTDSPSALEGNSPAHPGSPVLAAFVYSGMPFSDAGFQVNVSPPAAPAPAASMTTLVSSAPTSTAGDMVAFTATVAPGSGSGATPTGTVTFLEDGNTLGAMAVQADGTAALVTAALPTGSLSITAQYSGDSAYSGSTSAAIAQIVNPVGTMATTTMLSSSSPTPAPGTPVTLTATVAPVSAGATPTGNVNFFDNGASAGQAALVNGVAQLPVMLAPGAHTITATYAGDTTFAASTSAGVTETVTAAPTLTAAITKDTLPTVFVPGDRGFAMLQLTNTDTALARAMIDVQAFLTPDGIPADGVSVMLPAIFSHLPVTVLANGGMRTMLVPLTVPANVAIGNEQVVLTVAAVSGVTAGQVDSTPAVDPTVRQAMLGFGTLAGRSRVMLMQNNGGAITRFALVGPGTGMLNPDGNGGFSLALTGTTAGSIVVIMSSTAVGIDSITADSAVGLLVGQRTSVNGDIALPGGAREVVLSNVSNSAMTFGGAMPITLVLGDVSNSSVRSTDPINAMVINSWTNTAAAQSLSAPSIRVLLDKGPFAGNIATTGNITTALIKGDLTGDVLAGASLGADNAPGGGDDTFAAGSINTLIVQGNVSTSVIGAGLSINDDTIPLSGNDTLIPGSSIRTVLITGTLADDSRILSAQLPSRVRIGTATVITANDARFAI